MTEAPDETFEALIVGWEGTAVPDMQADATSIRHRVEALCGAGAHVFVVSGHSADEVDGQLCARPSGRGRLFLCCTRGSEVFEVAEHGPVLVARGSADQADAARWAARWLGERGITGGLVLLVGPGFDPGPTAGGDPLVMVDELARSPVVRVGVETEGVPGGTRDGAPHGASSSCRDGSVRLVELLDAQLARRAAHRVPQTDLDPAWVVPLPEDRTKERVAESLGTLANGSVGTRGSREEGGQHGSPMVLVSGAYADGRLLPGPIWTGLALAPSHHRRTERRLLDLHAGILVRRGDEGTRFRSMRFVSAASPYALALRAEALPSHLQPGEPLRAPQDGTAFRRDDVGEVHVARTDGDADGETDEGGDPGEDGDPGEHANEDGDPDGIVMAAHDRVAEVAGLRTVERTAAWVAAPTGDASSDEARQRLAAVDELGFDALLAAHREAWAERWADAEVVIEGDPDAQLAARFAVFHLLSAAADTGESAVGARGLTGDAYAGHVFWDSDVFVLPALAACRPEAARSILEYRIRRLPAAREAARARGLRGARFPWESAKDGTDVTPRRVLGRDHQFVPINTGTREEHIVADVAWSAACYAAWTGDDGFLAGAGRDLVVESARYWASRIARDADGRGHILGVMGPDEYHQTVDDNAFTNVMARWNLRRGADLVADGGESTEADDWRSLAEDLVDGWNAKRGLYEQFTGYFDLEPLLMAAVAPPPVTADLLLGAERVARSQLIKQSDVLMLHHLVPEEVVPGSLAPCLAFYEPRTAHGSSLSPAISASLLARAGDPERALKLFHLAARLDLDDLTGTTARGVHLATMGGLWQALAYGFLGLRPAAGGLDINPCLPAAWSALGLRLRFGGARIGVRAEHERVSITCEVPVRVRIGGGPSTWCAPPGYTFPLPSS